ncbi:MAG: hypothetical protein ACT4PW_01025 [Acidimicrobiia bacterium]
MRLFINMDETGAPEGEPGACVLAARVEFAGDEADLVERYGLYRAPLVRTGDRMVTLDDLRTEGTTELGRSFDELNAFASLLAASLDRLPEMLDRVRAFYSMQRGAYGGTGGQDDIRDVAASSVIGAGLPARADYSAKMRVITYPRPTAGA